MENSQLINQLLSEAGLNENNSRCVRCNHPFDKNSQIVWINGQPWGSTCVGKPLRNRKGK